MALWKLPLMAAMREARMSPKRSRTGMPMPRALSPSMMSIMLMVASVPRPPGRMVRSPFSETSK